MNYDKYVPWTLASGSSYAAAGPFRAAWDDVQQLPGGGRTYVRGADFQGDFLLITGTQKTFPQSILRRIIDAIRHEQVGGHVFYDLSEQAGVALEKLLWAMDGKRQQPANGTDGAVTINTTNTTVRLKFYLPYSLRGGLEQDDANIPLSDLAGSAIEGKFVNGAAGGAFDTGSDDDRVVSGTLRASVDLVHRDEDRRATYFTIASEELQGLESRLFINGRVLHWLIEIPVHADGVTENFITDAERNQVTLEIDDTTPVDREDVIDLNARWNRVHAQARAEELPVVEGDASPWVALYVPPRKPYKITQLPAPLSKAKLRVTGTDTTPRIVRVTTTLHQRGAVIDHFKKWNQGELPEGFEDNPEAFLSSKTASKTDFKTGVRGVDGPERLPIKLNVPRQT